MFCSRKQEVNHPKWIKWCKKSEKEQLEIAEKNEWDWYTDWYDVGDNLRYKYEQADKSKNITRKYGGYDRWDENHQTKTSNVFVGADGHIYESNTPINQWTIYSPCTNKQCPYNQGEYANSDKCGYFGCNERQYDCFNDLFASIQAFIDVCGADELDNLQKDFNIHKDIIGWFKFGNKYFKGDDKMSKPFWTALSELKFEDEISVYWTDGMMYINDENDGQASTNTSLYQAYRFAILIQATIFDYTATDEEIKELSEQLLDLIDEDWYRINVWEYFDDIADDFKHLTGIPLDIDDKRAIVCSMTEMNDGYDLLCSFGSATYIAKTIWDYIKGNENIHIPNKNGGFTTLQGCDNKTINQLADKYLQSDEYDLRKFATELHKECQYKMDVPNNFNEYLIQSSRISYKCYELLKYLLENDIDYKQQFLVGYIDWFGDYQENERYIYCHIDSSKNEIYFQENRKAPKSAYLHDIAFPHLVFDTYRIQKDIEIRFTEQYIDDIMEEFDLTNNNRDGYIHCHMYGTVGKYTG